MVIASGSVDKRGGVKQSQIEYIKVRLLRHPFALARFVPPKEV
ncbi:MAG: hypothetical protein OEU76_03365 [Cyclobacteriaceae bacterium]|nr:hypothetical protein [Cyclobacteriaceae bacterium]